MYEQEYLFLHYVAKQNWILIDWSRIRLNIKLNIFTCFLIIFLFIRLNIIFKYVVITYIWRPKCYIRIKTYDSIVFYWIRLYKLLKKKTTYYVRIFTSNKCITFEGKCTYVYIFVKTIWRMYCKFAMHFTKT